MPRVKTHYICQQCGYEAIRWLGRCPDCGSWNTLTEEVIQERAASSPAPRRHSESAPIPIDQVAVADYERRACGIGELDRVLGGGCVPGSVILIGGDPGIGKSTLLMQAAARLSAAHGKTLYVTGEESVQQVRMRAERLGALCPALLLSAETDLDTVEGHLRHESPEFAVIDSIQTMVDAGLNSAPATVTQLRGCCARLTRAAKQSRMALFIVGHVTKEGTIAGPRVLEHMVDTVLYFEGERFQAHRILRAVKNRFGSTDEIGIFEMSGSGLLEVPNPSELLLSERPEQASGSAVVAIMEGTRPLLVEVQALVSRSYFSTPRRVATGVDYNRVCMLLAVLEKRCGLRMSDKDVYVNVAGGLRLAEPAADLAVAVALASSHLDVPVLPEMVLAGEVGLAGEVRAVQRVDQRLREAARLGFCRAVVASAGSERASGGVRTARTLRQALGLALQGGFDGAASIRDPHDAAVEETV